MIKVGPESCRRRLLNQLIYSGLPKVGTVIIQNNAGNTRGHGMLVGGLWTGSEECRISRPPIS